MANFVSDMEKVRNIIFDFDGTLADTAPVIVATMHATIRELGLPQRSDAQCRSTIGIRLEDIPPVLWSENQIDGKDFAAAYRKIFNEMKDRTATECFPGVLDTLADLHRSGYSMAIASSRSRKSLEDYVEEFGISRYFATLIGGNDVELGKPAPDPVLAILGRCGWRADKTLTVGDAGVDILMGRAAGTATCAVTYGNGSPAELSAARPDYIIGSFPELIKILSR